MKAKHWPTLTAQTLRENRAFQNLVDLYTTLKHSSEVDRHLNLRFQSGPLQMDQIWVEFYSTVYIKLISKQIFTNKNSSLEWWLEHGVAIIFKYYIFSKTQGTWSSSLDISA